ncbi:hypothetical protein BH09BAC5_BH09BAC5_17300 [soil metagenome]
MKKLYFSFLIFCLIPSLNAQQYFPLLDSINTWNYTTNYIPVRLENPTTTASNCSYPYWFMNTMTQFTIGDTVIGSYSYKIVEVNADQNPNTCFFGFVREDTAARKVFFLDNLGNPEITLYDFSMTIGNSIPVIFTQQNYFISGLFTLDSITSFYTSTGWRPAYHLNDHANSNNHTLTWIEGVGNLEDAFYPYSNNQPSIGWYFNCPVFPHDNWQFMTCFDHDYKVYYDSCAYVEAISNGCIMTIDTCNYWNICGNIKNLDLQTTINIFPNPNTGKFNLRINATQQDKYEIFIHDLTGNEIIRTIDIGERNSEISISEINLEELSAGFYLVECRGKKGTSYSKLIIEK